MGVEVRQADPADYDDLFTRSHELPQSAEVIHGFVDGLSDPLICRACVMAKGSVKQDHKFPIFEICIQPLYMAQVSMDINR